MAKDFNTILSEAQQIKNEIIEGANTALRTGTCLEDIVQRAESDEDLAAKKARTITAGNGLTGGGSLATDMELTVGATDDSIVVGADGIKVDTQDSLTSTSITKPLSAAKGKALQDTKANKTVTIEAGNGLTGGGDLSGNRTLAVASANDGIATNADNIQLNTIDALDSTSATKPLSAKQGKVLQDNKADKSRKVNAGLGLTGGGDLAADRTIDVVSANDGITVNADNIQLNTIDNVTSTSVTKPLSANQGKVLNDKVVQVETDLNLKINKTSVKQVTGTSETDVMSQKAVTDELAKKQDTNLLASYTHSGNKEVYISSIDYTTNTFTSVGHGLINSATIYNKLMLAINRNETIYPYNMMPFNSADLTVNGLFVINATADTFQLSTTAGGAAITLANKAENDLTKWHFEYTTVKTITISGLLGKINAGVKMVIDGTIIWGYAQYIGAANAAGLAYIKSSDGATPSFNYPVIYGRNDYPLPCFGGQIIHTDIYTNNGHRKIFDIAVYGYGTALNKVAMTSKYINFVTPIVIADSYKSFVRLESVSISNGTTIKVYSL